MVVRLPRTGRRAAKLYLPNGAFTFASRQAYGLAYRSQRETSHDRALGVAAGLIFWDGAPQSPAIDGLRCDVVGRGIYTHATDSLTENILVDIQRS